MRNLFLTTVFSMPLFMGAPFIPVAMAGDGHGHGSSNKNIERSHDEQDAHKHEGEDSHNEHKSSGGHDDHADGHEGEHDDEGRVKISSSSASLAGIKTQKAGAASIALTIPLTGRIILNENRTADVRARFPGFVKQVHVNLGDIVKKGDVLATVESNESLQNYAVKAPIDGVVLRRETNIGDVTNGKELFVIADLSTVWARYHVFPRDVAKIKKGQSVSVHALDEKTRQVTEISMVFPTADALSQTVIAIAELPNAGGVWRPGMTVEGDVKVSEKRVAIAVPKTALQFMEDKQVVFVKEGDSYEPRPVNVGMAGIDHVEIKSGLKSGETYVSAGSFVIKADILKATAAHSH